MEKSDLIPTGNVDDLSNLVSMFGCKVGAFPSSYLALPLGPYSRLTEVSNVIDNVSLKGLDTFS